MSSYTQLNRSSSNKFFIFSAPLFYLSYIYWKNPLPIIGNIVIFSLSYVITTIVIGFISGQILYIIDNMTIVSIERVANYWIILSLKIEVNTPRNQSKWVKLFYLLFVCFTYNNVKFSSQIRVLRLKYRGVSCYL